VSVEAAHAMLAEARAQLAALTMEKVS